MTEPLRPAREIISEPEAVAAISEIYPRIENPGYVLWNETAFPFYEGDDPLGFWLGQVDLWWQQVEAYEARGGVNEDPEEQP